MEREILVLEALSALTGCTVKPSLTTSNNQPAVQIFGQNELTFEKLFPTLIISAELQSPRSTGGSVQPFRPQNPLDSGPDNTLVLKKELFVSMEEFFSPGYDCDFRGTEDPSVCFRGGEPYTRPWGWYRFALKVKDKYPEGNTWLEIPGRTDNSSTGEWPVSFHGTSLKGAEGITKEHYKPGPRELFGFGIYSTPDIEIAERFARKFTSKTDEKTYKVVMQNRINPKKLKKIEQVKDYWLIEIASDASQEKEKEIVTESIRPYGILIKEV